MKFRAKVSASPMSRDWEQRLAWCRSTFGSESHDRWMPKHCYEFRFTNEQDLAFYLLRWGI